MFGYQRFQEFQQNSWMAQCVIQKAFRVFRVVRGLSFFSEFFLTTDHTEYTEYI